MSLSTASFIDRDRHPHFREGLPANALVKENPKSKDPSFKADSSAEEGDSDINNTDQQVRVAADLVNAIDANEDNLNKLSAELKSDTPAQLSSASAANNMSSRSGQSANLSDESGRSIRDADKLPNQSDQRQMNPAAASPKHLRATTGEQTREKLRLIDDDESSSVVVEDTSSNSSTASTEESTVLLGRTPIQPSGKYHAQSPKELPARPKSSIDGRDDYASTEIDDEEDLELEQEVEDSEILTKQKAEEATKLLEKLATVLHEHHSNDNNFLLLKSLTAQGKDIAEKIATKNSPAILSVPLSEVAEKLKASIENRVALRKHQTHALADQLYEEDSSLHSDNIIDSQTLLGLMEKNNNAFVKLTLPTRENQEEINDLIHSTRKAIRKIKENNSTFGDLKTQLTIELTAQQKLLEEKLAEFKSYNGPNSTAKKLQEKQLFVNSAIRAFETLVNNYPENKKTANDERFRMFQKDARLIQSALRNRSDGLKNAANRPAQSQRLESDLPIRKKNISEGQKIINKFVKQLDTIDPDAQPADKVWLAKLIDEFLKAYPEADKKPGSMLLRDSRLWVLNHRQDWKTIECEVMVPIKNSVTTQSRSPDPFNPKFQLDTESTITLAKIHTIMTPIGNIFSKNNISVKSDNSAINQTYFSDYKSKDPDDQTRTITLGRNSHTTTEHKHCVNLARTEAKAGNNTLFSGTRHATLSPYGIYPEKLNKADQETLRKIAEDLIRPQGDSIQIYVGSGSNDPTKVGANSAPAVARKPKQPTEFETAWREKMKKITDVDTFMRKLTTDEDFCKLVRRKVALNRAREAFLSEAIGNPQMLDQINKGEPVTFNSISLITPDPLRHFLAKLMPTKYRKHDELRMRREESQAWRDLQNEIKNDGLIINNKPVKGSINAFCIGVSEMSLADSNKISRALSSGWSTVHDDNLEALKALIGDPSNVTPYFVGGQVALAISAHQKELNNAQNENDMQTLLNCQAKIRKLTDLATQLAEMWNSGAYRHAGDQPYKFAARLALLSSELNAGTAFNCKSGKDRTAQLDMEVKLLAIQTESRQLGIASDDIPADCVVTTPGPVPYQGRTEFDRYQLQHLIFGDKSRTVMQRYNTGVEGSKLNWKAVVDSFATPSDDAEMLNKEFVGRSFATSS